MEPLRTLSEHQASTPWILPRPWRVNAAERESAGTVTLELEPPAPFVFQPGQFNMLYVHGIGEVPISISGDPEERTRIRHTIRDVGAVTHALCAAKRGEHVGVRGPYGTHWPLETAKSADLVIVAGGIGLPPLRPAIYQALRHRDSYGRVNLLYGARTPHDLLFTDELAEWRSRFDVTVEVTVDAAEPGWHGDVGVVPDLIGRATFDPARTVAFMVGPEIMMRFAVRALTGAGVADDRVYLSMEHNMQCAAGLCGHCQIGPYLVCRDGPVLSYRQLARWMNVREL